MDLKTYNQEWWMIGVIVSAIIYGGVLSLALSYGPLLLKTSYDISQRMRNFLLVYVTFMVAMSTVYLIATIIVLKNSIFGDPEWVIMPVMPFILNEIPGILTALCVTFVSWGADGFMLWRCAKIYEGVSRPRRIALIAVLVFMALISLVSCLIFLIMDSGLFFFMAVTAATVILNLVTATLITLRILYFNRYIRRTVGLESSNPYMTIIIICVESSALIVVFSLIYLILIILPSSLYAVSPILIHVYVLSPLLIVYRVARGKAATIRQRPSGNGPVVSALYFEPPPLSSNNNEA